MSDFSSGSDSGGGRSGGGRGGRRGGGGGRFGKFGPRIKRRVIPDQPLDYKNIEYLGQFIGPTGKIQGRRRTGFSGQDQRKLAHAVKLARFIGLLPYVGSTSAEFGDRRRRD